MKLNLGCGSNLLPEYLNVDKFLPLGYHDTDSPRFLQFDLDCGLQGWPWPDNSVSTVKMIHSLEHMGQHPEAFTRIIQELYRVCEPNAEIFIAVPHPRHDDFINDPTHVRAITPEIFQLFSKRRNLEWQEKGYSNSQLAFAYNVDFDVLKCDAILDPEVMRMNHDENMIRDLAKGLNNVVKEFHIMLRVVKE